jgi:hypothetical protein
MKRPILTSFVALFPVSILALGLTGCTVARNWQYPPDPPGALLNVKGSKAVPIKVGVLPLRDLRGQSEQRGSWVVAFPLVPYGTSTYDRPETVKDAWGNSLIRMDPPRDFAKAIASELQHADIFSSVMLADSAREKPDLILSGTIRSTNWKRTLTTYGLGPVGPFFWVLGAPMGNTTNTVVMDLQLAPANDTSRVLWQFTMQFENKHLIGIYYGMDESVKDYAEAVQEALQPAIRNLTKIAVEHPEMLRPNQPMGISAPRGK